MRAASLRRMSDRRGGSSRHRPSAKASLEVTADSKVCMRKVSRRIGFAAIRSRCGPVSMPARCSPSRRFSKERPLPSHPSVRRLLLGVPSLRSPLAIFRRELYLPGISALIATSPTCVHSSQERSRALASFRPRAFSAPRRFPPQVGLRAYFIPQPRPGPILFRGLFSPRSRTISSIV
jgi:hypothetical protein